MVRLNSAFALNLTNELSGKSHISTDISATREKLVRNFISKNTKDFDSKEYYEKELTSNIKDMIVSIKKGNPGKASKCLALINRYSNILGIRAKSHIEMKILEFEENLFYILATLREHLNSNAKVRRMDWQKLVSEFLLLGFPVYTIKKK